MLGDNAKEIAANSSKDVVVSRLLPISVNADPVHEIDAYQRQAGVYRTNLLYIIRYTPCEVFGPKRGKQFLIKADLLDRICKKGHRFVDFEDFCNSEEYKEVVPFLLKYTTLSQRLFDIAEKNAGLDIPISFDVFKYYEDVNSKCEEEYKFLTPEGTEFLRVVETGKTICRKKAKDHIKEGDVE